LIKKRIDGDKVERELVPVRCRIPELLIKIGKDQQWLAIETGKHEQKISNYCTLQTIPNLRTAALIAKVIGCSIDDLHDWEWQEK